MSLPGPSLLEKKLRQSLPALSGIILDMDGVLVDTEPIHVEAFRRYLRQKGLPVDENFLKTLVGFSVDQNIRQVYQTYMPGKPYDLAREMNYRNAIYLDLLRQQKLQPTPGIPELIELCRHHRLKLALASSSPREQIEAVLENLTQATALDFHTLFEVIVSGDEVQHRKPDPEIYVKAVNRLQLPPDRLMAIEDSFAGVQSARQAGLFVVGLKNAYASEHDLQEADVMVETIAEIVEALKQYLKNKP